MFKKDIIETSKKYWEKLSANNKKNKAVDVSDSEEETQSEEKIHDDFRKLCLLLYLKCHQENLKFFQERC